VTTLPQEFTKNLPSTDARVEWTRTWTARTRASATVRRLLREVEDQDEAAPIISGGGRGRASRYQAPLAAAAVAPEEALAVRRQVGPLAGEWVPEESSFARS
jgi:hypothetical protein